MRSSWEGHIQMWLPIPSHLTVLPASCAEQDTGSCALELWEGTNDSLDIYHSSSIMSGLYKFTLFLTKKLLLLLSVTRFRADTMAAPLYSSLGAVNLCHCVEWNGKCFCLKMFHKTHHQLLNSVTLIHKWSMSSIPSPHMGNLFIIFNYRQRTSVICKHMLSLPALKPKSSEKQSTFDTWK